MTLQAYNSQDTSRFSNMHGMVMQENSGDCGCPITTLTPWGFTSRCMKTAKSFARRLAWTALLTQLSFGLAMGSTNEDKNFLRLWYCRVAPLPLSGIASIYWEGHKDARGKRFRYWEVSCAMRTERLSTWVVVTNLGTGKSIRCPIWDRGPHKDGRVIDLSIGAADALGCKTTQGLCRVLVERECSDGLDESYWPMMGRE